MPGHASFQTEAAIERLVEADTEIWYPGFTPTSALPWGWTETFAEIALNMLSPASSISFSQGHTSKHFLHTQISEMGLAS